MLNLKCKRYLEAEGRKCGHPAAERRFMRKQFVGTFCFPCWLEVMPTLPLSYFFAGPVHPMQESRARELVQKEIDKMRKQWVELLAEEEAKARQAEAYGTSPFREVKDFVDAG